MTYITIFMNELQISYKFLELSIICIVICVILADYCLPHQIHETIIFPFKTLDNNLEVCSNCTLSRI